MRTHAAAAAPLLALLLVAGCGDTLSKKQLVAKADAICTRVNKQVAKEPDPKTTKDLERLAKRTVEITDPALEDMDALKPPSSLERDFKKFVAVLRKQRDLTKKIGAAAGKGDTAKVQKIGAQANKAQDEYHRLTGKIGFKECGGGV
jgi:hypothetical protein